MNGFHSVSSELLNLIGVQDPQTG